MLDKDKIDAIATQVATANLGVANVSSAISSPTVDLTGRDALEITVVLTSESSAINMPPGAALKTLVEIHDELLKQGDQRFPFLRYATRDELEAAADDES